MIAKFWFWIAWEAKKIGSNLVQLQTSEMQIDSSPICGTLRSWSKKNQPSNNQTVTIVSRFLFVRWTKRFQLNREMLKPTERTLTDLHINLNTQPSFTWFTIWICNSLSFHPLNVILCKAKWSKVKCVVERWHHWEINDLVKLHPQCCQPQVTTPTIEITQIILFRLC